MGAQRRIATDCRTTVLTAADPAVHLRSAIEQALASLGSSHPDERRYDLLTMARLERLVEADDPDTVGLVVDDIKTAVGLHNGERLVIATRGNPKELVARLRSHPTISGLDLIVNGVNLNQFTSEREEPTAAIVSCMDWRQHGSEGGLITAAIRAFGPAAYAVLSTAGGAKEFAEDGPRYNTFLAELKSLRRLKRLILTCHTDCGKYGGDEVFEGDFPRQLTALSVDLEKAHARLTKVLPDVDVYMGIVQLDGRRAGMIRAPVKYVGAR